MPFLEVSFFGPVFAYANLLPKPLTTPAATGTSATSEVSTNIRIQLNTIGGKQQKCAGWNRARDFGHLDPREPNSMEKFTPNNLESNTDNRFDLLLSHITPFAEGYY